MNSYVCSSRFVCRALVATVAGASLIAVLSGCSSSDSPNLGPTCTSLSCEQIGAQCGVIDDGCGMPLLCGECTAPATCGGGGLPFVCAAPACVPTTCEQAGKNCGEADNGCGGTLSCGSCPAGQSCGAGGKANVCGNGTCTPRTCAQAGAACGKISDGCSTIIDCGDCTSPETCGGTGQPNVCGTPACTPTTCVAEGKNCGQISDKCGGTLGCGTCSGAQTCGGSGTPNVCGIPGCTPTSCVKEGKSCGEIDDGCGGKLQCGTCKGTETCGGGGTPNVCAPSTKPQPLWSTVAVGGGHACAVTQAGELYCWGANVYGEVGDGTYNEQHVPVRIGTSSDWMFASAGAFHTCAISQSGKLFCWGQNTYSQLGDPAGTSHGAPWEVPDKTDLSFMPWTYISLGTAHTCGQKDNSVYCWGDNTAGQLADGTNDASYLPRKLGVNASSFSAGSDHVCVTAGVSSVPLCAGFNTSGQLGVASPSQSNQLIEVHTNLAPWDQIAGGGAHTCAVHTGGSRTLYCWGWNDMGQLGVAQATPGTIYQVGTQTDWLMAAAGSTHTCALSQTGSLSCWGDNAKGELGIGGHNSQSSPQPLGPGWAFVSAGEEATCAVKLDGTLWCWGKNLWGQLGNGTTQESTTPAQVLLP
ncbi:MAG: hypothetical protein HY898_31720 [Deltaproteobacteria bacterium]|nr:hypothetical protein [Deltaproteobacteria bacterium]